MGYRLVGIDKSVWTYKTITPTALKYRITYFEEPEFIFYDNPYIKRSEEEFYAYCRNVGWMLAGQWGQMQIFVNATDEYHEIETDYQKELVALKSIMSRRVILATVAMSGLAIVQGFFQLIQLVNYPVKNISSPTFVLFAIILIIIFLAGVISASGYFSWLGKARVSIKKFNRYPESNDSKYRLSVALLWVAFVVFIAQTLILAFKFSTSFAYLFISQIIIAFLFARRWRLRGHADSEENFVVDKKINKVLSIWFSIAFVLTFTLNGIINLDWFNLDAKPPTHTVNTGAGTLSYDLLHNNIPLKIEDLIATDYPYYSYSLKVQESILARYTRCSQYAFDLSAQVLNYEIVELKNKFFYNSCVDYYISLHESNVHQTNDPAWNANKVYQVFDNARPLGIYIVCYDDMIVYYNGFDTLTSQQAEIAYEKLFIR